MHVYIAVLTGGEIRYELAMELIAMSHDSRHTMEFHFSWGRPISSNRNQIVKRFLESKADCLLMLDKDVWPYGNLLDLVENDLDVVSFPTPIWRPRSAEPPIVMNVTPLDGNTVELTENEPVEILRGGGSAILIARRVLEKIRPAFEYRFDEDGVNAMDEDIDFFDKVRRAGFKIWTSHQHVCGHVKTVDIVEVHNEVAVWRKQDAVDKRGRGEAHQES